MLTNFTMNRDRLNRMDGKSQEAMHTALRDWMAMASEQRLVLWQFEHMVEVITLEDVPKVQNAKIILHQIQTHLVELEKTFDRAEAVHVLTTSRKQLDSYVAEVEQWIPRILKFIPK